MRVRYSNVHSEQRDRWQRWEQGRDWRGKGRKGGIDDHRGGADHSKMPPSPVKPSPPPLVPPAARS